MSAIYPLRLIIQTNVGQNIVVWKEKERIEENKKKTIQGSNFFLNSYPYILYDLNKNH